MNVQDILSLRLQNQGLISSSFKKPEEVVQWLGAVQSQDYPNAKWAVGQRIPGIRDTDLENAYNDGNILRTHVMRPTWHFVTPHDIRWMLSLTAPRINGMMGYYNRLLKLDTTFFKQTQKVLVKALRGHNFLTRKELAIRLKESGYPVLGQSLGHVMMQAELDQVICSGPMRGKQFTYALLEERAPHALRLSREEALVELAKRYFISHGPAQIQDFVWWSGLTSVDAKNALKSLSSIIQSEEIDGKTFWFSKDKPPVTDISRSAFLLPNYDEYTIAYKDRSAFLNPVNSVGMDLRNNIIFNHSIVIGGRIVGGWKREIKKNEILIIVRFFTNITPSEKQTFQKSVELYVDFFESHLTGSRPHIKIQES